MPFIESANACAPLAAVPLNVANSVELLVKSLTAESSSPMP